MKFRINVVFDKVSGKKFVQVFNNDGFFVGSIVLTEQECSVFLNALANGIEDGASLRIEEHK